MRGSFFACLIGALIASNSGVAEPSTDVEFEEKVRAYLLKNPEVILEALAVLTEREEAAAQKARIDAYPDLFARAALMGMGEPKAPIRVVEFFDYKCVPCKAVHKPLASLVKDNPNLRIEMRQLPILTPGSEKATRFAFAVLETEGEAAYQKAHDLLWAHRGPFNTSVFSRMADTLGLDYQALDVAMWTDGVTARIDANRDMAIDLNLVGTPAFVTKSDIAVGTIDIAVLSELFLSQ